MSITIEEGKFYRNRDGLIIGPMERYDNDAWMMKDRHDHLWIDDGQRYYESDRGGPTDLVEEVPNPAIEDDGFITRDTPDRTAQVEAEAAEERVTDMPDAPYVPDETPREMVWRLMLEAGITNPSIYVRSPSEIDALDHDARDIKTVIADEAKRIVSGARRSAYGKPEANFERIARFWQAYFENTGRGDVKITATDVSPLMRLMKEARLCESPAHYDSFVDLVGYSLTGAEVNHVLPPTKAA